MFAVDDEDLSRVGRWSTILRLGKPQQYDAVAARAEWRIER
jgi:hypothetical protein